MEAITTIIALAFCLSLNWQNTITLNTDSLPRNLSISITGRPIKRNADRDTIPVKMLVTGEEFEKLNYAREKRGYEVRENKLYGDIYFGGQYLMDHVMYLDENKKPLSKDITVWIILQIK